MPKKKVVLIFVARRPPTVMSSHKWGFRSWLYIDVRKTNLDLGSEMQSDSLYA